MSIDKKISDEIISLLRTRKCTIVTHDRGEYDIYVGKYFDYDELPEEADYHVSTGGMDDEGYIPAIVSYLAQAQGIPTLSI